MIIKYIMPTFEQDKFLPNYDDNEIIYWEDDWIFYKFPNKRTEENKHEAECFDSGLKWIYQKKSGYGYAADAVGLSDFSGLRDHSVFRLL